MCIQENSTDYKEVLKTTQQLKDIIRNEQNRAFLHAFTKVKPEVQFSIPTHILINAIAKGESFMGARKNIENYLKR